MKRETLEALEYEKILRMLAASAASSVGGELASSLLPSSSLHEVSMRLAETDEAARILDEASLPLASFPDIRPTLKKALLGAMLEAEEFSSIRDVLFSSREVKRFFKEQEADAPILKERAHLLEILGELERDIDGAIDEHGALRDDASPELSRIRRGIHVAERRIKDALYAITHSAEKQKALQENIVTIRSDRYVVPVKEGERRALPGIVHDQSSTGATLFVEPMEIVPLNNEVKRLTLDDARESRRILRLLSDKVRKNNDALLANLTILAETDFAFAKARLAKKMRATRPMMNDDGTARLIGARHPLIDDSVVVPVDISLGEDFRVLLITGPNTGGKTVSMKTLGLLALMAESGLFIPAEDGSRLPMYREVFADIGDDQSIGESLSTFSSHIGRIVSILDEAEAKDLLLLDEIGAGTDPYEGAALSMAIIEKLLTVGAGVVATTHYPELKAFAYRTDGVENASMEFDEETLSPTYRLMVGLPGASNALSVSLHLGMGEDIVDRAKSLMTHDRVSFEEVARALEAERREYERLRSDALTHERRAARMEEDLRAEREALSRQKERIIRAAKEEGAELVRRARREADEIIRALKEQKKTADERELQRVISGAKGRLSDIAGDMSVALSSGDDYRGSPESRAFVKGDRVYVIPLGQKGTVRDIHGGRVVVDLGIMETTVKYEECRFVSSARGKEPSRRSGAAFLDKAKNAQREIDVRGMTVDEGESVIEKFLDDAALAGLKEVVVIHGKGTGALRRGVHDFLRHQRGVAGFSFADSGEGGTGATVVRLS